MDERVLEDDYPVHAGYLYVADGKVVESDISGDVKRLKRALGADEIRRCDIVSRERNAEDAANRFLDLLVEKVEGVVKE